VASRGSEEFILTFITKKALPRRTFLRAAGTTPRCRSLTHGAGTHGRLERTGATPGFVYVPHILTTDTRCLWSGVRAADDSEAARRYRDWLTVVTNLARPEERAQDHACTGAWLTGVAPKRTDGADFLAGKSIDQIVAERIGKETTFPSLEVATEDFTAMQGACGCPGPKSRRR
jgi:hypothetical protein